MKKNRGAKPAPITVFIDRDGVLNRDPGKAYYVRTPRQFKWIPGVLDALKRLNDAGARLVVVSNQAGVGKGLVKPEALGEITRRIYDGMTRAGVQPAGIFYCLHVPEDACGCRKPRTGLFDAADRALKLGKAPRFMIGDTERDLEAGRGARCRTVLVLSGKTRTRAEVQKFKTQPDTIVRNLKEAATWVLNQKNS